MDTDDSNTWQAAAAIVMTCFKFFGANKGEGITRARGG